MDLRTRALTFYRLSVSLAGVVVIATIVKWSAISQHMAENSPLGIQEARTILGVTTGLSALTILLFPLLSEGLHRSNPSNRKTRTILILSVLVSLGLIQPVVSQQYPDWMRILRLVQIGVYVATAITVVKLRKSVR